MSDDNQDLVAALAGLMGQQTGGVQEDVHEAETGPDPDEREDFRQRLAACEAIVNGLPAQ